MTNKEKLTNAINEAERFLARARTALREIKEYQEGLQPHRKSYDEPLKSSKFATAKRASLDLSIVLAELRRGKI